MPLRKKRAVRVPMPPLLMPGDKFAPANTPEEIEENKRLWTEYNRYVASLFTLEQLQEIVAQAGAPPLKYTSYTSAILRRICHAIEHDLNREERLDDKKALKRYQKEWMSIRRYIGRIEKEEQLHDAEQTEVIWSEYKDFRKNLSNLISAMDAFEEEIFPDGIKERGQHKGAAFKSIYMGCELFEHLSCAWSEAGITGKVSDAKRYQIVRDCMAVVGESASVDAIRIAIKKRIREDAEIEREELLAQAEFEAKLDEGTKGNGC